VSTSIEAITIDRIIFDELRGFGDEFVADLIAQFVLHTESLLVQLADAVQSGDRSAAEVIAHTLKGSSAQLGGIRLALSCERLEDKAVAGLPASRNDLQEVTVEYENLRSTMTHQLSTEPWPLDPVPST
jgi:HPt (histidine-containing phosphotransfer) domain-containing protein